MQELNVVDVVYVVKASWAIFPGIYMDSLYVKAA